MTIDSRHMASIPVTMPEQRAATVPLEALANREHRRRDDRAAVHRTAFERVVEVFAVRRRPVDERGLVGAVRRRVSDRRARGRSDRSPR